MVNAFKGDTLLSFRRINQKLKLTDDLKIRVDKKEKYYEESFKKVDEKMNDLSHDLETKTWERIESQKRFEIYMMGKMDQLNKELIFIKKTNIPALELEQKNMNFFMSKVLPMKQLASMVNMMYSVEENPTTLQRIKEYEG
jgi:hypothetical protein